MKTKLLSLCSLPLLLGMVSCSGTDTLKIVAITSADAYGAKAYEDGSGNYSVEKTTEFRYAVTDRYGSTEAFVSIDSALSLLKEANVVVSSTEIRKTASKNDPKISYEITGSMPGDVTITVDAEKDTITFSDYDVYRSLGEDYVNDMCSVDEVALLEIVENKYVPKNPSDPSYTFDLSAYDIDILKSGLNAYMPTNACSSIFLNPRDQYTAFNGKAFYHCGGPSYITYRVGNGRDYTDFGRAYYNGGLTGTTPSQELSTLHGNEIMFYLDHFYGFPDRAELNGRKYSQYLKEEHKEYYDLFFSTSGTDTQTAWDWTAGVELGDGHTRAISQMGSFYTGGDFTISGKNSERVDALYRKVILLGVERVKVGVTDPSTAMLTKETMFQTIDDMAIIRFDGFGLDLSVTSSMSQEEYYNKMESDLYSHFAYAFSKIKENPSIKKVVFDITCNGGGYIPSAMLALCFLKEKVTVTSCNPSTGSLTTATYRAKLPDGTSAYEGKYDYYVLQSGYSFSCGNLFPTLCKNNGVATLMGEKSGGGACAVRYLPSATGQWVQISGDKRLSLTNGIESNDGGIEPDVAFDSANFYDMAALREALN